MKKKFRILKNKEFQFIKSYQKHTKNKTFFVYYFEKQNPYARAGIAVSKKSGSAVIRNKIKRQIKVILQKNIDFYQFKFDFLIYPRLTYQIKSFQKMKTSLLELIKELG